LLIEQVHGVISGRAIKKRKNKERFYASFLNIIIRNPFQHQTKSPAVELSLIQRAQGSSSTSILVPGQIFYLLSGLNLKIILI
jgi:hypothetical protein